MYPQTCPQFSRGIQCTEETKKTRTKIGNLMRQLEIPRASRHTFAARSFRVKGPTLWNQLPEHVRKIEGYSTSKKHLKTFYFKQAFT